MTEPQPTNGNGLTGADMLALVSHITGLLSEMEGRIMDRLSANSQGATDRWKKHDDELAANTKRVVDRFEAIEKELLDVSRCIHGHIAKEHDEEIAMQARVKPVRTFGLWLAQNWRSIMLALLALAGILGWAGLETHIVGQ
jgi:UDP-2,3-diacylglucosamine pyrophosphatase LpxH